MKERTYICCDLKSFFASVECVERGLDPMTTNLVVADKRRTEKTICLAVSPSLKAYGIATPSASGTHLAISSPALPGTTRMYGMIPPWPLTTSWSRPGWPTTSTGARRSTAST